MQKKLKIAAFAGIVYLVSFLPELVIETIKESYLYNDAMPSLLMITYIISTLSTIVFFYGFVLIGNHYNNNPLVVSSLIIILTTIFYYIYEWYTIDMSAIEYDVFGVSVLLLFGFAGIFFGVGLYKLRTTLGNFASIAGILEIIVGFFFVTVILFLLGLILSIPAIIFEILLLFKVSEFAEFQDVSDQSTSQTSQNGTS